MKLKNSIGILALISAISLICLAFIMMSQSVGVSASLVQLGIFNFAVLIALTGLFIVKQYSDAKAAAKKGLALNAAILVIFAGLVAFNIIDIQLTWNILIAIAVAYMTLVQMQLLKWSKSKNLLKLIGLLALISNIYIFTFFIFKISSPKAGFILDIAVLTSIISLLIGIILTKRSPAEQS